MMQKGSARNSLKLGVVFVAAFLSTIAATSTANADLVYSTFGPGQSYDQSGGWVVGAAAAGNYVDALPFTPGFNAVLDSIHFAASHGAGTNNVLNVSLMSDGSGLPSGTSLETFTFTNVIGTSAAIYTATSATHPQLHAGTKYWVVLSGDGFFGWNVNKDLPGTLYYKVNNGNWQTTYSSGGLPAFDVTGTAVPIPTSALLLASGLVGLVGLRRRFKK